MVFAGAENLIEPAVELIAVARAWNGQAGRTHIIYSLTRAGRKQLQKEEAQWLRATGIVDRFFKISENAS